MKKASIKSSTYDDSHDLIIWTLEFNHDNKEQSYCYSRPDYLSSICNISENCHKDITTDMLKKHCSDMVGKQISFAAEGEIPDAKIDNKRKEEVQEEIRNMNREASKFCDNIMDIAESEFGFNDYPG